MNEMSKLVVIKNLIRYIQECSAHAHLKSMQPAYRCLLWGKSIVEWNIATGEVDKMLATGKSEFPPLQHKLDAILAEEKSLKFILLTDGNYSSDSVAAFQNWRNDKEGVAIRTIAIGADSNNLKLSNLSTNGIVFSPEDMSAAIESLIFNPYNSETFPERIPKVLINSAKKSQGKSG